MSSNHNEKIGYCNPPRHAQFKKGVSGNPKGRSKGPNLATVLEKALREKVVVSVNGRRKTVTKLEAATRQLVNQAASGDLRALQQLVALARSTAESSPGDGVPNRVLAEVDRKVLEGVLGRLGANLTENKALGN